jgi:hypothetical protein
MSARQVKGLSFFVLETGRWALDFGPGTSNLDFISLDGSMAGHSSFQISKGQGEQGAVPPAWGFHPHTPYFTQARTAIELMHGKIAVNDTSSHPASEIEDIQALENQVLRERCDTLTVDLI